MIHWFRRQPGVPFDMIERGWLPRRLQRKARARDGWVRRELTPDEERRLRESVIRLREKGL